MKGGKRSAYDGEARHVSALLLARSSCTLTLKRLIMEENEKGTAAHRVKGAEENTKRETSDSMALRVNKCS